MNQFQETLEREWQAFQESKKGEMYPNIMLIGASGAGKSSLINTIFNGNFSKVSNVRPETQGYDTLYKGTDYGKTVNLIDTAGYELGEGETYYGEIHKVISNGIGRERVHLIWYCISIANERVQEMDFDILRRLMEEPDIRKRVCVVFTKCDKDTADGAKARALKEALDSQMRVHVDSFETSADKQVELQLQDLIRWSKDAIDDEDLKRNFIAAQMSDLDAKRDYAQKIIAAASVTAAGIGAVPIPFSDAVLLVPVQVGMVGKIIDVYGVSSLAHISAALIGDTIISQVGKSLATSFLKMIPVVGQIIGSAVNAGVASAITGAVGYATSEICYTNVKAALEGRPVAWDKIFDSGFTELVAEAFRQSR